MPREPLGGQGEEQRAAFAEEVQLLAQILGDKPFLIYLVEKFLGFYVVKTFHVDEGDVIFPKDISELLFILFGIPASRDEQGVGERAGIMVKFLLQALF